MTRRADIEAHIGALLDGTLSGDEAVRYLGALDISRLNPEQLAGAVDAVMARAKPFPVYEDAIDCCGTGGDGRATYNISTAAALVVAARGVKVAKHGNRAVTSKSGSADVLEALGMYTNITSEHAAKIMDEIGICFLYAPTFHPGFARVAPLRKAIGRRTIFNLLGPLCNPARVKRQLIGVFAAEYSSLMAETAQLLGRTHVMVVHGEDGTDEFSITGNTHVSYLQDGTIRYASIRPQDAGLSPHEGRTLIGGDATQNARALRDVLDGIESPYADAVLLNAAAMLMLADKAPTLYEGVALARSSIARGEARQKLEALIEASFPDA
ncbi:MAG: anthranilate phosphoribosyltransferase [Alphaproteobacteria bacterium]|nr:anthranilate phosphoribosyltransferase [Alphaproteobacteria bacterium]